MKSFVIYWDPALPHNQVHTNHHSHRVPAREAAKSSPTVATAAAEPSSTHDSLSTLTTLLGAIEMHGGEYVLHSYANALDLLYHVYELSTSFSSSAEGQTPLKQNPVLVVVNAPEDSASHGQFQAVLRFLSYLDFNFPTITAVLFDGSNNNFNDNNNTTYIYSNDDDDSTNAPGTTNVNDNPNQYMPSSIMRLDLPLQKTDMEMLFGQLTILGRQLTHADRRPSLTASLHSFSNIPQVLTELNKEKNMISFKKSYLHVEYFILALESFHNKRLKDMFISKEDPFTNDKTSTDDPTSNHSDPENNVTGCIFDSSVSLDAFEPKCYATIFNLSQPQVDYVTEIIWEWDFYAHKLTSNQLVLASFLMFKHAFALLMAQQRDNYSVCFNDDDKRFVLSDGQLLKLLLVLRDSYRPSNPYHNFAHAVDVLQAIFQFLINLNVLPRRYSDTLEPNSNGEDEYFLSAVETLTILIVAIGHDVGHPGVTNMFLTNTKAPIAAVFNYKSVLESFHSAVFTEILAKYWPAITDNDVNSRLCKLIVKSILATDMALHFDYMKEVKQLLSSKPINTPTTNGGPGSSKGSTSGKGIKNCCRKNCAELEEQGCDFTTLVCCLLIKCADISNVTRRLAISAKWGQVLAREFGQVEELELLFGLKPERTALTAAGQGRVTPYSDDDNHTTGPAEMAGLARGQLFFITTFAKPLFEAVTQLLPQLGYTVDILNQNEAQWRTYL
ncbi:hypothetical protein D0Z00_000365 [Geotrichum galactomycetum]|uniref:Uncharacterized protein n=1 Tax=Geotrichum galactomycetum TaxID=27317 RepID=A0ACB6VA00_9ASCO|nr:hypothetical protein D0Z00_000365 [Geotrichum candidum]